MSEVVSEAEYQRRVTEANAELVAEKRRVFGARGVPDMTMALVVTLTVERHDGATWLCALEPGGSRPLARFADEASVEAYKQATNLRDRHMHEMGRLGL